MVDALVTFRSQVTRVDGRGMTLRVDTLAEAYVPNWPGEPGHLLATALCANPLLSECIEGVNLIEDQLPVGRMVTTIKTLALDPEELDDDEWVRLVEEFEGFGMTIEEGYQLVRSMKPRLGDLLKPWGGQWSGLAIIDEISLHPAMLERGTLTKLLARELASIVRPHPPVIVLLPSGSHSTYGLPMAPGWRIARLDEDDMHTRGDASHRVQFGV